MARNRARAPRSISLGELVYQALREAVLTGAFLPGEPLRQELLAAALGVSRVPVRSAFIQLEADGLIDLTDPRGAVIRTHSAAEARENYEIRELLEVSALRRSMATMTPARIVRLRRLSAEADERRTSVVDARSEFYRELFDAENNPGLVELLEMLRTRLGRYIIGWRFKHEHGPAHDALVDAVEAGDDERAVELVRAHLAEVLDGILQIISDEQAEPVEPARHGHHVGGDSPP